MLPSIFHQLHTSGHVSVGDPDSLRAFRACTGGVQTEETTFFAYVTAAGLAPVSPTAGYSLHSCAQPLAILVLPPSIGNVSYVLPVAHDQRLSGSA